ncbi:MAG: DMT family transporter [Proteobacteria bacterium]|nr:DMT family transporter [Pseudomonadota bacterium]MBI3497529.1 DMT family transporter [Pseudomonadota bacterium]
MKLRDLALVLLINLIWGLTFIAGKIGLGELPPVWFTGLRFAILLVALAPMLRIVPQQMPRILAVALFSGALHFSLMYSALKLAADVSTVAIVSQLALPLAVILAVVMLRERISLLRLLGMVAAFAGVVVIGFDARVFGYIAAVLLVIAACLSMAFAQILMRGLRNVGVFNLRAWVALVSAPILLLLSLGLETGQVQAMRDASPLAWAALAYTAIGSSLIGFGGMYYLLKRYPVSLVTPLFLLAPIFAVIAGITLLGDVITLRMMVGTVVTLAGVLVITLARNLSPGASA